MVSFYRLKYTNFISSDNYLVGLSHEINPESRFLALGTRKGYLVADLSYSCFLARRASLFLFGSLVRRSHPAVSFGYRFYDSEDLFNEFSTRSLSYVRDWVPGLLTNYKALFRTALKEEGALRRIGFFFQFPDILLMFGSNNSIGFIINEARSIQVPAVVTGDTSLSFSQVTYMLLGNYKSFRSTMFFVKLFLDLNEESRRFRTLRHYSVFKRLIKSIFLRRTLKSKLFSIKLASMFFIFQATPKLRVSQVTPIVYKGSGWASAKFFKLSKSPPFFNSRKRLTMGRSSKSYVERPVPVSRTEYAIRRRVLLNLFEVKFRQKRLALLTRSLPLPVRRFSLGNSRGKVLKCCRITSTKLKPAKRRAHKVLLKRIVPGKRGNKALNKLLGVAKKRGLKARKLIREADKIVRLNKRLKLLNGPSKDYSYVTPLPMLMFRKRMVRQLFPFLGYFAYGHMAKRLNTLFFYRAVFRQVAQKRKRVLRFKRFTSNLKVIGSQAKKFRALNLAVHRKLASIFKLRARVKRFGKRLRAASKLNKLRKVPGFDEKLYIKELLAHKKRKPSKQKGGKNNDWVFNNKQDKRYKLSKFDKVGKQVNKKNPKSFTKTPRTNKLISSFERRQRKIGNGRALLINGLRKPEIRGSAFKPKLGKGLGGMTKVSPDRAVIPGGGFTLNFRKKKISISFGRGKHPSPAVRFASVPTFAGGRGRRLMVQNFTPTQRHVLRVYRILLEKYPYFLRRSRSTMLSRRSKIATIPRTLYQFLLKRRKLRFDAYLKRTGNFLKFSGSLKSQLPRRFWGPKRHNKFSKHNKGKKPWYKHEYKKGKGGKNWHKKKGNSRFKGPYNPDYSKNGHDNRVKGEKSREQPKKNYVKVRGPGSDESFQGRPRYDKSKKFSNKGWEGGLDRNKVPSKID